MARLEVKVPITSSRRLSYISCHAALHLHKIVIEIDFPGWRFMMFRLSDLRQDNFTEKERSFLCSVKATSATVALSVHDEHAR